MTGVQQVKRALISVSNKEGVASFAQGLAELGIEILSTGGTAKALRAAGIPIIDVADYTASPEVMEGRVKTLHPRVHGGILMRDRDDDRQQLHDIGGHPIDLVCVNLYPFAETLARGAGHDEIIENIDIGGPSMLRSAAKNHARVTVLTRPQDYDAVLKALREQGGVEQAMRQQLATYAFRLSADYDAAIAQYLEQCCATQGQSSESNWPERLNLSLHKISDLRYGENPHQRAAVYRDSHAPEGSLACAEALDKGDKELSFNNWVDLDAALECVLEFVDQPAAVVIKHANPCGVSQASTLEQAFRQAREADALSAFGSVVAFNRKVDAATAAAMIESFVECVIAPSFDEEALAHLHSKKNLRILATHQWLGDAYAATQYKRISGGAVVQDRDRTSPEEISGSRCVTKRQPTADELADLEFAWRVVKHVKSNAIVLAKQACTYGVGAGQMSRVMSVDIAARKAAEQSTGCVLASDAFFPFADGVQRAAEAGVRAIVQPGGSKRDDEVIAAANAANIAMIFTGTRHFRH